MGGGGKLIGRGSEKKVVELDGSFNATAKAVLFNSSHYTSLDRRIIGASTRSGLRPNGF